ncbi:MAG: thioredoxin domain-containing protein, partial [Proteobacteria bacterium]|nr:thioredoxin domain-containing protein [Pseudomonadota bacterium]
QIGRQMTDRLQAARPQGAAVPPGEEVLRLGYNQLRGTFDSTWGGFGNAPKFPTPHHLTFLLRWQHRRPDSEALVMVEKTLRQMRWGGIYDHLGFGFARYSVDQRWLAPHFEKMLYDQALLLMAYVEAHQVTGKDEYRITASEIAAYVLRDMTSPEGAFFSAEDADSEGEEGKFYVWTPAEIQAVLGPEEGEFFGRFYDVTETGNFEGKNILHQSREIESFARQEDLDKAEAEQRLAAARQKLFEARRDRVPPLKDDKVLVAWNGLMIAALAQAGAALGEPDLIQAAARATDFVYKNRELDTGRLFRRWRDGEFTWPAYADDYAFFIWGLVELYQAGFDPQHLASALELQQQMNEFYWDQAEGGYFFTPHDGEQLIVRDKEIYDGALPSSNAVAALNLVRLSRLTGDTSGERDADRIFRLFGAAFGQYPMAHTQFLGALDFGLGPSQEVVVVAGDDQAETEAALDVLRGRFNPRRVVLFKPTGAGATDLDEIAPWTKEHTARDGQATVYVCDNFACQEPVVGLDNIRNRFLLDSSQI